MGKKLIIKGADFSSVAVPADYVYTCNQLLTLHGNYSVDRTQPKALSFNSSENWRCGIIQLHNNMYVENATAMKMEDVGNPDFLKDVPEFIYLSGNEIANYIQNSEFYASDGTTGKLITFSGYLNPPSEATYVIINTNIVAGGDVNSIISWDE